MRITAKKTVFYGWEFYYRFESSAKGKTIALSLRENDNVIYEHKRIVPARLKELSDENIANEMLPRFIVDLFTSDKRNPDVKEKMAERRKSVPLGIAWILDRERLIVKREWANKTIKEYDYIANKMIALWGEKNIQDIKPWDCEWKKNGFGERDEKCAVRFMTILCTQEIAGGYLKEDIWENYQHNTPRKKRSQQSSIRANIENRELTDGQCTQIVQSCMTMIEKDDRNKELYYASLLLLLMGMDISELCALSYSSIRPLEHYKNRYTLLVKDTFQRREGKQNCTLQRIENPYQIRILPCSTVVSYSSGYPNALKSE